MKINRKFILLFLAVVLIFVCIPVSGIIASEITPSMTLSAYEENGKITVSGSVIGVPYEDTVSILVLKGTPKSAEAAYSDPSLISAVYECPISDGSYKYSFGYDSETDIYTVYASYPDAELNKSAVIVLNEDSALFTDSVVLLCDTPVYNLYGEVKYMDKAPYIQNGKVYVSADVAKEIKGTAFTNDIDVSELVFSSVIISDNYAILSNNDSLSDNEIKILKDSIGVFVSKEGSDSASGAYSAPVATLEKAVSIASNLSSPMKNIHIFGGEYEFSNTLTLTEANTGVKFNAIDGEKVVFSGGTKITAEQFEYVLDDAKLSKFPESVHGSLMSIDLSTVATLREYSASDMYAVYSNDRRMNNARFPNDDYGYFSGNLTYSDAEKLLNWKNENAFLFFYDTVGWLHYYDTFASVDGENFTVSKNTDAAISDKTRFFVFNSPSELDRAGEWCLIDNTLYYYPESDFEELYISSLNSPMISLTDADDIKFEGIDFKYSDDICISSDSSSDGLYIKNSVLAHSDKAISALGNKTTVERCEIFDIGSNAITLSGGNTVTLDRSDSVVTDCRIYDFAVVAKTSGRGVEVNGVGNTVKNCEIFNSPHIAILFTGNDHTISNNEIYNVVSETSDAGAIYAGRSWIQRGTVVKENYIHDLKSSAPPNHNIQAIYFDDGICGNSILNNVIENVGDRNVGGNAVMIGGGREVTFSGNTMINCNAGALYFDARMTDEYWYDAVIPYGTTIGDVTYNDGVLIGGLSELLENPAYDANVWRENYDGLDVLISYLNNKEYTNLDNVIKVGTPANAVITNNVKYSCGNTYGIDKLVKNNATTYKDIEVKWFANPKDEALAKISYGCSWEDDVKESNVVLYPKDNDTVFTGTSDIHWAKDSSADSYKVIISKNADLSSPIVSTTTKNTYYSAALENGDYYLSVTALRKDGSKASVDEIIHFKASEVKEKAIYSDGKHNIFVGIRPQKALDAQIIYGLYSGNKLTNVDYSTASLTSGTEYYLRNNLTGDEGDSYNFFLWEENLKPYLNK